MSSTQIIMMLNDLDVYICMMPFTFLYPITYSPLDLVKKGFASMTSSTWAKQPMLPVNNQLPYNLNS